MVPCVAIVDLIREGFEALRGVVTDLQLRNLMMIGTAVLLHSRFSLSEVSRSFLRERSVNAFSHCLKAAKFRLDDAAHAYALMLHNRYELSGGRFIIDDTLEHHTSLCRFIHGVCRHWDHVFGKSTSAKCLVFLYYSQGGLIKFPIGWRIYFRGGKKTKNDLAIELIRKARERGFPCGVVMADSWFCVEPFVRRLQRMRLRYILDLKTNATIRLPIEQREEKRRGRKRQKWYRTENVVRVMNRVRGQREIGFIGDVETGKPEKVLYELREKVCVINALPGQHKIVYSYDPRKKTEKYLITNELSWEGVKVVKEYFHRWAIEEFFRNAKQQLDMEGACVRSKQGVTITLFLVSYIDSLIHSKIAELAAGNSKSEPLTVQSIVRLAELENAERFVSVIKSAEGEKFLKRWIEGLRKDSIRKRVRRSEVAYLDRLGKEGTEAA